MRDHLERWVLCAALAAFLSVLFIHYLYQAGIRNRIERTTVEDAEYRREFFSEDMLKNEGNLSKQCRSFLRRVQEDSRYFPVPESTVDGRLTVSYVDSWMGERNYKGSSVHEGTDIMAGVNERGR